MRNRLMTLVPALKINTEFRLVLPPPLSELMLSTGAGGTGRSFIVSASKHNSSKQNECKTAPSECHVAKTDE